MLVPLLSGLLWLGPVADAQQDEIDAYITKQMQSFDLPGVALAVVKDGKVIKSAGYGVANRENRTPMTADTVFKIASVSKQFIAAAIMLLAQDGRLAVDDRVSQYLEGTPSSWQSITVRHLLTHTSGLVRESPAFDPNKLQSDAAVVKAGYAVPLQFEPGARWQYSNLGYFALAEIVTRVSGRPWNEFLHERVFKPAGMLSTAATHAAAHLTNRARGYAGNDNNRAADDWTASRPSGGFYSTVLDLAKWDAQLYGETPLAEITRREMWTAVSLHGGASHPYGLGWHVSRIGRHRAAWHGGGLPGFSSQFIRLLDARVTIILLANGDDVDLPSIAAGLVPLVVPATEAARLAPRP